jgi:hypothetical protein
MSDDIVVESEPKSINSGKITETITVPFAADMSRSQHAKFLRQVANLLHAYISNSMRYAAIGEGNNAGAGAQVYQQVFQAAANIDAAATGLEHAMRQVLTGQMPPPPGGSLGRA